MLAACHRRRSTTPVWFMRQAGRCLAGYRRLRERYEDPGDHQDPRAVRAGDDHAVDTFEVDGAVLYADIMLPLYGMGVPFSIDPGIGPIVHQPVKDAAAVEALRVVEAEEATPSCSRPSACSPGPGRPRHPDRVRRGALHGRLLPDRGRPPRSTPARRCCTATRSSGTG